MPLTAGEKYALYELLATHSNDTDGKSSVRVAVENSIAAGSSPRDALRAAAFGLDNTIDQGAIGDFDLADPATLRTALALDDYTGGACPGGTASVALFGALKNNMA